MSWKLSAIFEYLAVLGLSLGLLVGCGRSVKTVKESRSANEGSTLEAAYAELLDQPEWRSERQAADDGPVTYVEVSGVLRGDSRTLTVSYLVAKDQPPELAYFSVDGKRHEPDEWGGFLADYYLVRHLASGAVTAPDQGSGANDGS